MVYALIDPRDRTIRYVGQTKAGSRRAESHWRDTAQCGFVRRRWLAELRASGAGRYAMTVLERVGSRSEALERETAWILHGRRFGWPLANENVQALTWKEYEKKQVMTFRPQPETKAYLRERSIREQIGIPNVIHDEILFARAAKEALGSSFTDAYIEARSTGTPFGIVVGLFAKEAIDRKKRGRK